MVQQIQWVGNHSTSVHLPPQPQVPAFRRKTNVLWVRWCIKCLFGSVSIRCTLNLLGIAWKLCFHLHFWGCLGKAGRQVIPTFSLPMSVLYFVLLSVKNGWFCQMGIMESRKIRVRWTFPALMLPGATPEPAETVKNFPATPVALLGV